MVLLRGLCSLAKALARARELGKEVVLRLRENSDITVLSCSHVPCTSSKQAQTDGHCSSSVECHFAHLQKEEEYANAQDQAIAQARYLAEIQTQHDDSFQRVVEGSVNSSAKSDGPGVEELSEDGALSQAMSDDDPDLAPREWSQTGGATAVAQEPPPAPVFPKALSTNIVCSDAERAQVLAWDMDSVQAMHAWCQERLDFVIRATPEG